MKHKFSLLSILLLLGLLLFPWSPSFGAVQPIYPQSTPIINQEFVRNGNFNLEKSGWNIIGMSSGIENIGQDSGPALVMYGITENQVFAVQELHLPTQTTAATLAFNIRLLPPEFGVPGISTAFYATIQAENTPNYDVLATALAVSFTGDSGWQPISYALTGPEVSAIQAAHAAGKRVFVVFSLYQEPTNVFKAYLDNISFQLSGEMDTPIFTGSIAYIGLDDNRYAVNVKRIPPAGGASQTLWTHPSSSSLTNYMADIAWKPDASEVAFSSNHEGPYSAFQSDVYGIEPDGNGLRRITNPPSKAELEAGGYQVGSVTGKVYNNYGNATPFLVYIQGATDVVSLNIGNFGDEVSFTFPEVADLGVGLQYVVFTWSNLGVNCANGKEYAAAVVDVQAGQTVDAGTLQFGGTCGENYNSAAISWKRDGSEVSVDVITPRKFQSAGEAIGSDLFNAPAMADKPAWSPVDGNVLYVQVIGGSPGIYLTTEGGGSGTRLVDTGSALWVTPAWLPDGSGFVYTTDRSIHHYDLASSQDTLLAEYYNEIVVNPSLSPDGQYIVFERYSSSTPANHDLWIMNRSSPVQQWPLTKDGKSTNPDWSRQDPPVTTCTNLSGVSISGPVNGTPSSSYTFTANLTPANASTPVTYTWTPAPASGQGTASASYSWTTSGQYQISMAASNCSGAGSANAGHSITISQGGSSGVNIYLPVMSRHDS